MHATFKLLLLLSITSLVAILFSLGGYWAYLEFTIEVKHEISINHEKAFAVLKFNNSVSEFTKLLNRVQIDAAKSSIAPVTIYTQYFKFFHKRFLEEISHGTDMEAVCGIDFSEEKSLAKIQFFLIKNPDYKYFLLPSVKVVKFTYPVSETNRFFNYVSGEKLMRAIESQITKIDPKHDLRKLTMLESTSVPSSDSFMDVTFSVPIGTYSDDYEMIINHF